MGAERADRVSFHPGFQLDMAKVDSLEYPATQDRDHALPGKRLLADIVPLDLLPRIVWRTGQHVDPPEHRPLRNPARQQPGREARHGVGREPSQSPLPQLVGLRMRDLKPPAPIHSLTQIGYRCPDQLGNSQARVIGKADQRRIALARDVGTARGEQSLDRHPFGRRLPLRHRLAKPQRRGLTLPLALLTPDRFQRVANHPGLRWQRLLLAEPEDAVDPGDRGDPPRQRRGLGRRPGIRTFGQPVEIVDKALRIGGHRGDHGPPRLAPAKEAPEVGGDRRLCRRRHRRNRRLERQRARGARVDQRAMRAQHQLDRGRERAIGSHAGRSFRARFTGASWAKSGHFGKFEFTITPDYGKSVFSGGRMIGYQTGV